MARKKAVKPQEKAAGTPGPLELHAPDDPRTTENFIAEKRIGERIKRLRLKKSMGLVELGRHTGLSASFLSQLETGRVVPTLRNLARIAMVFSKDLSYFFEAEPSPVFRLHAQRERVKLPQSGTDSPTYLFESLGYMAADRVMDPYLAEFLPQPKANAHERRAKARVHQHDGFEFLYVVEGALEIQHGGADHKLAAHDAAYFDASLPHSYWNPGERAAKVIIVTATGSAGKAARHPEPMAAQTKVTAQSATLSK